MELFIHDRVLRMTCPSPASLKLPHSSIWQLAGEGGMPLNMSDSSEGGSRMNWSHLRAASHLRTLAYRIWKNCGYLLPQVALTHWSTYHWILGGIQIADPKICSHPLCHLSYHASAPLCSYFSLNTLPKLFEVEKTGTSLTTTTPGWCGQQLKTIFINCLFLT